MTAITRALFIIPILAIITALGLAAPATSQAAVSVLRVGYCGGDDWEPAMASDSSHVYLLITHFAGDASCDPASGQNNSRIMIQVSADGGKTFSAPAVVAATPGGIAYPNQADPAPAVGSATGAVYLSLLAYGVSGGRRGVYLSKSSSFGLAFTQRGRANGEGFEDGAHPQH